jgi:peptidoglycan/LPS O-acetylase OafA/YrhL
MLVAYIQTTKKSKFTISFSLLIPVFAIASAIMWNRANLPKIPAFGIVHTYNNVLSVLTVYIAINANYASIPFTVKNALSFLGKISYSIYLYHLLFLTFAFIVAMRIELHGDAKAYFILLTTCVMTIPAAAISYRYIEKPFIDFSKKIGREKTIGLSKKAPNPN